MLRLGELLDRAVIDMEAAEKIGEVDEVILDPEQCRVAGLSLVHGRSILGGGTTRVVSAASVHSIGADAVTVSGSKSHIDGGEMPGLPRRKDVVGRKVVGQGGDLFGHIEDVLIDPADGRIIGYELGEAGGGGPLENLFGTSKDRPRRYVRADADLRVGSDIVVVPDASVLTGQPVRTPGEDAPPASSEGWGHGHGPLGENSPWRPARAAAVDRPAPAGPANPEPLEEGGRHSFEEMRPAAAADDPLNRQPRTSLDQEIV